MAEMKHDAYGELLCGDGKKLTRKEAAAYISFLTREEKQLLNEMLKALERKRPLSAIPPASIYTDG